MSPTGSAHHLLVWAVAAVATAGVVVRPFRWPEAVWACGGALVLVATGLLAPGPAVHAVGRGLDVYLFLTGMMLLSETARREGLFEAAAVQAVRWARGDPRRLFLLVYGVGVVVTALLSNDAAAVVLTPAVYAAARKARVEALPYLLICAFVANAASFVLPISNPANLVLYGDHVPPLGRWLARFALPSALSVIATYAALRWVEGHRLKGRCESEVGAPEMAAGAWTALVGVGLTAVMLLLVSALGVPLGAPTCAAGALTAALALWRRREPPWPMLKTISWGVLPLVAGLFVLVEALQATGVVGALARAMSDVQRTAPATAPWALGGLIALACNLTNNLPAGLIASSAVVQAHPPERVVDALMIGVDLGPNFSVTGSLATVLWLTAIRREGEDVGAWRFLKLGVRVAPPALILALAARLLVPG